MSFSYECTVVVLKWGGEQLLEIYRYGRRHGWEISKDVGVIDPVQVWAPQLWYLLPSMIISPPISCSASSISLWMVEITSRKTAIHKGQCYFDLLNYPRSFRWLFHWILRVGYCDIGMPVRQGINIATSKVEQTDRVFLYIGHNLVFLQTIRLSMCTRLPVANALLVLYDMVSDPWIATQN